MLQRAASNAYSWWWASHVRTKQSKWLDNNLQDMDSRVKCILLLLGEEADSFAKRAEMYYKRRPEVISSVEEAYRAYRALAERYDHMSGELHKANHTIATAFPDQVQYAMLEEDDDNLPKAFTTVDPRKIHKSTVEGLMKKKRGGKSGLKDGGENSRAQTNKENAQEEISRMQKEILVLQTEKEFIKSSYESGIAKYWDLEKKINDMQEEVCYFQEEFNESAVIEDDEARALMAASALKSCEDTIMKLQEQQKLSFSQAMVESERVNVSNEKLKNIMGGHGKSQSYSGTIPDENVRNYGSVKEDGAYFIKQEKLELQAVVDKIKEYFQTDSEISVVEMADKIDELVNKVVDLELMVSSQTAQVNRLCLENTELEKSLQELEEEKAALTSVPGELNSKLKKAEEDLTGIQNLESSFHRERSVVHSNFTETIVSFHDVSGMLWSPLVEQQISFAPVLTDEATLSVDSETSGECDKTNTAKGPQLDESGRKPDADELPDHSNKLEPANLSCDIQSSTSYPEASVEEYNCADGKPDIDELPDHPNKLEPASLSCDIQSSTSYPEAKVEEYNCGDGKPDIDELPDHSNKLEPATLSCDQSPSSYPEAKVEEYNSGDGNPDIDELPDHSNKLEPATLSCDSQSSRGYPETEVEKIYWGDDSEDLWYCALEDKSSFAAVSVDEETEKNADNKSYDDHNNIEEQHANEILIDNSTSMQQYIVHSHQNPESERLHHTSSNSPGDHNVKQEENKQDSSTSGHSISEGNLEQKLNKAGDSYTEEDNAPISQKVDTGDQEEDMTKLQQLLLSGLQDKEKVLLTEYTSILRNYKNAKRRLTEVEKKIQEQLNEMTTTISELRCTNAMKDEEIRSLHERLNSSTNKDTSQNGHQINPTTSLSLKSGTFRSHQRTPSFVQVHQRKQSVSSISRIIVEDTSLKNNPNLESSKEGDASHDVFTDHESIILIDVKMESPSPLEEKFRNDIDALLEENLQFWMKFSASFQQIQGFQTKYDQLQSEVGKLEKEDKSKLSNASANDPAAKVESDTIEKQLRELKIELQVWLEQITMLKGELQYRFSSLCSIQEEIEGARDMDADPEEGDQFTSYQAAKFQGEVLNMKQENSKVADELQSGLDHVKGLQTEIEKVMTRILKSASLSESKGGGSTWRHSPSRSRVPLRLFLFPAKKKKLSLLNCVNPSYQKQHSDMQFFTQ